MIYRPVKTESEIPVEIKGGTCDPYQFGHAASINGEYLIINSTKKFKRQRVISSVSNILCIDVSTSM